MEGDTTSSDGHHGSPQRLTFMQKQALKGLAKEAHKHPANRCPRLTGTRTGGSVRSAARGQ